jgi:endonuclease/exonuclease/phosphatase family metal-dependent hydrolase
LVTLLILDVESVLPMIAVAPTSRFAEWFTRTVPRLRTLDRDRRRWLVENPDGKLPLELNWSIPEINEIEVDNGLSRAQPGLGLRVAAWNLERGRHWREAAQLMRDHPVLQGVDVLCLSEMDDGMVRAHNEHTTRELALALGMNYAYTVEFLQLSLGTPDEQAQYSGENDRGYHGNAILSRYPLQSVRMLRLPGVDYWYGAPENRLGGRNALFADIQVGTQTVTVISTHLESGRDRADIRLQESQLILRAIGAECRDRPVIVCGDLNAGPRTPVMDTFRQAGFLVDEANDPTVSTYQKWVDGQIHPGRFRIDYVMPRGLRVVTDATPPAVIMAAYPCQPTGHMLSDHAIAIVDLQV